MKVSSLEKNQKMYDDIVPKYKEMVADEMDKPLIQQQLQRFATNCETILDAGCGVGNALQFLHEKVGLKESNLYGCDLSPKMVAESQKLMPNSHLFQGSITTLSESLHKATSVASPSLQIDGLLCFCVLQHLDKEEGAPAAFAEFRKILNKPDKKLLLCFWGGDDELKKWGAEDDPDAAVGQLYSVEFIEKLLTKNGFQMDQVEEDEEFGMKLFYVHAHVVAAQP